MKKDAKKRGNPNHFRSALPKKTTDIAEKLRIVRNEIGKSQEEVAANICVKRQTYTRYEAGLGKISLIQLNDFIYYANSVKPDLYLNPNYFFDDKADLSKISSYQLITVGISAEVLSNFEVIKQYVQNKPVSIDEKRVSALDTLNIFLSNKDFPEFIIYMTYLKNKCTDFNDKSCEDYEFTQWQQDKHIREFIDKFLKEFQPIPKDATWELLDRRSDDCEGKISY